MSEQPTYLPSARRPRPGRPRKPESGHVSGTSPVQPLEKTEGNSGTLASQAIGPVSPRLLDLDGAARYLAVSPWTIRDLEAAGTLRRVRVPVANGGELRKVLFDRTDLDHLIEVWKDAQP